MHSHARTRTRTHTHTHANTDANPRCCSEAEGREVPVSSLEARAQGWALAPSGRSPGAQAGVVLDGAPGGVSPARLALVRARSPLQRVASKGGPFSRLLR
eukprot:5285832-Alexandrium_andersonii.AAC.1